jgi:hypothetical protein
VIPIYDSMPHYIESLARYERLGFALMDLFVVRRKPDGRIVEYDCVMVRASAFGGLPLKQVGGSPLPPFKGIK